MWQFRRRTRWEGTSLRRLGTCALETLWALDFSASCCLSLCQIVWNSLRHLGLGCCLSSHVPSGSPRAPAPAYAGLHVRAPAAGPAPPPPTVDLTTGVTSLRGVDTSSSAPFPVPSGSAPVDMSLGTDTPSGIALPGRGPQCDRVRMRLRDRVDCGRKAPPSPMDAQDSLSRDEFMQTRDEFMDSLSPLPMDAFPRRIHED